MPDRKCLYKVCGYALNHLMGDDALLAVHACFGLADQPHRKKEHHSTQFEFGALVDNHVRERERHGLCLGVARLDQDLLPSPGC